MGRPKGAVGKTPNGDARASSTVVSGAEMLDRLAKRGIALNASAQALAAVCGDGGHKKLDDCFKGRSKRWPKVPEEAAALRASVVRMWTDLTVDIRAYAKQLADQQPGSSAADFASYLRNVVLAKVELEATVRPATAACTLLHGSGPFGVHDVEALAARGVAVVKLDAAAGIDFPRLRSEMAELHKHGVISPTVSSCNPGAHGINLRCGTAEERQPYDRGTPTLRAAIELLRSLPLALERAGYSFLAGTEALAVPGVVLASVYPPGAYYSRHLDCYGDDNARALTMIMYANDCDWSVPCHGGALRLEPSDSSEPIEVAPAGGTLVVFESRSVWHEVLASKRLRFALTLWLYAAPASASPMADDGHQADGGHQADDGHQADGGHDDGATQSEAVAPHGHGPADGVPGGSRDGARGGAVMSTGGAGSMMEPADPQQASGAHAHAHGGTHSHRGDHGAALLTLVRDEKQRSSWQFR